MKCLLPKHSLDILLISTILKTYTTTISYLMDQLRTIKNLFSNIYKHCINKL